jgi:hypothetical protein
LSFVVPDEGYWGIDHVRKKSVSVSANSSKALAACLGKKLSAFTADINHKSG